MQPGFEIWFLVTMRRILVNHEIVTGHEIGYIAPVVKTFWKIPKIKTHTSIRVCKMLWQSEWKIKIL